jgi:hypothetical protein
VIAPNFSDQGRPITERLAPALMIDSRDRADISEPIDANDPTDRIDAAEPTEPIDTAEPMLPTDSTDPRDPMHRIESSDHNDHFELKV